ncbi:hypothetical protein [Pseudoalteromonas rhizosphaerae]|uniref:hypothetical protein n=1 Tax=Pseudoalteromonas rhizosphaerae TaxID=2518973 RepID=UPI00384C1828
MFKVILFFSVLFLISSLLNASVIEKEAELKIITWNQLFGSGENLLLKKIRLTAFYTDGGFHKDSESAYEFSSEYLVFPFHGDITENFINRCSHKLLIVEGVIHSHEVSRAPRIKKVSRLSPVSEPEFDCLAQIVDFKS